MPYQSCLKNERQSEEQHNAGQNFTSAVFADRLDDLKINLVDQSVKIDDVEAVSTYEAGLLTITLPDIDVGEEIAVTFQVRKAAA